MFLQPSKIEASVRREVVEECVQLCGAEMVPFEPFDIPVVVARNEGGEVVGFLATNARDDLVVAGPLYVSDTVENRGVVAWRLAKCYKALLGKMGIDRFLAAVAPDAPDEWEDVMGRYSEKDWGGDPSGHRWFEVRV